MFLNNPLNDISMKFLKKGSFNLGAGLTNCIHIGGHNKSLSDIRNHEKEALN
jgi:hypothetical protein